MLHELIKTISGLDTMWKLAGFAIAAILLLVNQLSRKNKIGSQGKVKQFIDGPTLLVLAGLVALIALVAILASAPWRREPDIYRVRILVVDPQNVPVTGVTLRTATLNDRAVTLDGVAELTIPRGTLSADHKVVIYADLNAMHTRQELILANDLNPSFTIQLEQKHDAMINGFVEDDGLRAVAGASVTIIGGDSGVTSMDGKFSLKANAAVGQQVTIHVEKAGYASIDQQHPAGPSPVTIELPRMLSKRKG